MNRILLIDTRSNKEIKIGLQINAREYIIREKIGHHKTQAVLSLIDKLLKQKKLRISDINGIKVNTGSGSFTGIRVGMAIANAFSFALKIPVRKVK